MYCLAQTAGCQLPQGFYGVCLQVAQAEQDLHATRHALTAKAEKLDQTLASVAAMRDAEAAKDSLLRDMRHAIEQAEQGGLLRKFINN